MKRVACLLAGAVLAATAVPAFAGGEKCTADAQTCLNHMAAKKDKGYMGLELDKDKDGAMVITKVIEGAGAAKAGFMVGDVLVSRNGIPMADYEAQKKDKDSWKVGATVAYTVRRNGAEKKLDVTLGKMPESTFAQMVGQHMLDSHVAVATAVETEKKGKK